ISIGDLSNPLVLCALALVPVTGGGRSSSRAFVSMARWTALPMPQARLRGTLPVMPLPHAQELLGEGEVRFLTAVERRLASAPGGVIVVEGAVPERVTGSVTTLVMLAGPIIARLASLQESRDSIDRLTQQRDRLNLILENVADPILVTDERANIILMNDQAEQLFQASEIQQRSRRQIQAVRGNDTKFTSFISEFALLDTRARRERMALVHPANGNQLPIEVVSGKIMNERGEPIAIVSVLHDR